MIQLYQRKGNFNFAMPLSLKKNKQKTDEQISTLNYRLR